MTSITTRIRATAACQILLGLGTTASVHAQCPRLLEPFELFEPVWEREGWTGYRHFGLATQYTDTMIGGALAGKGDFNGDGLLDVVVGAPHEGAVGRYCSFDLRLGNGSAYIVLNAGGPAAGPHPDRSLVESPVGVVRVLPGTGEGISRTGHSVAFIGDINGDGFDDVAIGQPEIPYGYYVDAGTGQVFVIFGSSEDLPSRINPDELDGQNGFRIRGAADGDFLGWSVSAAGDINSDGLDDFILGAPGYGDPINGAAFVFYGRDSTSGSAFPAEIDLALFNERCGFRIDGAEQGEEFGRSVANLGDINGDGYDDLAVGAPGRFIGEGGRTYVVFGRDALVQGAFPDVICAGTIAGDLGLRLEVVDTPRVLSGWTVASAGDVNGDGLDDILIGAAYASDLSVGFAARAFVVFGRRDGGSGSSDVIDLKALNGQDGFVIADFGPRTRFGSALAGVDLNGDGYSDVIAGRTLLDDPSGGGLIGAVMVLFGRDDRMSEFAPRYDVADIDGVNGVWLLAPKPEDVQGFAAVAIAPAGDLNGDGLDDLMIGSPATRDDGSVYCAGVGGAAYVVLGRSPRCCADLDYDGQLTIFDFLAFQALFNDQHPFADFDRDGEFTLFDFLAYQSVFEDGCR